MHPSHLLDEEDMALLQLWQAWRAPAFAGVTGYLPFSGGAAEQPACVMECLKVMEAAAAALRPKADEKTGSE